MNRLEKIKEEQKRRQNLELTSPLEEWVESWLNKCGIYPGDYVREYKVKIRGSKFRLIDFAFPEQMIALEIDGKTYHDTPSRHQKDNEKTFELQRKGWTVLRWHSTTCWNPRLLLKNIAELHVRINPNKQWPWLIIEELGGKKQTGEQLEYEWCPVRKSYFDEYGNEQN